MKTIVRISILLLGIALTGFNYSDVLPKGWFKAGSNPSGYRVGIDNKVSQHGGKSAFIESVDPNPTGFCTLMQEFTDKKFSNQRVKLTGYVKTEGTRDSVLMWVRVDNADKRAVADFDNMGNRPIVGKNDWKKCEIIFDVPSSKCNINFGLVLSRTGKAWIDNLSFEIIDNKIRKTASDLNAPISYKINENAGKSINLDFED